ncbi:MAG: ribonucleotide reductase subunit alpha [Piscirickettsiaceae bacterium]|nr:MAG: ribonucleotide reductase subunit alpha [Piscirickettsiaceae bacterium]
MNITDYASLLAAAKTQAQPQRLLFVFLKASLPKDHEGDEESRFHAGQGGQLQPVICVDKTTDELGSFADLVIESEKIEPDWQVVLVASLSGKNGTSPSPEEADDPLKKMLHTVENGGDLSRYMAFDREGTPLQFG